MSFGSKQQRFEYFSENVGSHSIDERSKRWAEYGWRLHTMDRIPDTNTSGMPLWFMLWERPHDPTA